MRTSASSAPGTPDSPRRGGCSQGGKSVVVLEARDRVGGRIWTQHALRRLAGRPRWRVARPRSTTRSSGSRARSASSTYKTWVKGAHLLVDGDRTRRYTGLIPKISPLAVVTIALAQIEARSDGRSRSRSTRRGRRSAPPSGTRARSRGGSSARGSAPTIARDLFEMAVRGLFTGDLNDVSFLHLLFLVRAHGSINTLFSIEGGAQENMVDGGAGSIARRVADDARRRGAPERAGAVDHATRRPRRRRRRRRSTVSARHVVVADPARARARHRVRSRAARRPARRCTATRSPVRRRRRSSSTTSRSGAPTGSAARPPSPARPPR